MAHLIQKNYYAFSSTSGPRPTGYLSLQALLSPTVLYNLESNSSPHSSPKRQTSPFPIGIHGLPSEENIFQVIPSALSLRKEKWFPKAFCCDNCFFTTATPYSLGLCGRIIVLVLVFMSKTFLLSPFPNSMSFEANAIRLYCLSFLQRDNSKAIKKKAKIFPHYHI